MNVASKLVRKLLKNKIIVETEDLKNRLERFKRYRSMSIRLSDMNTKFKDLTNYCGDKAWLTIGEKTIMPCIPSMNILNRLNYIIYHLTMMILIYHWKY